MRKRHYPLPASLLEVTLRGFEDENDDNDDDNDDDDGSDDKNKEGQEGNDTDGLRSALQKERRARKAAERERNKLKKQQEQLEENEAGEVDKAKNAAAAAEAKAARLATRLKDQALDNLILKHAGPMNFLDIDDALTGVDREAIDWDQDEDDPSLVTVDEETVKAALKALATKKPHFLGEKKEGGPPKSGSKNAGNSGKNSNNTETDKDEALRKQYPALRRSAPIS